MPNRHRWFQFFYGKHTWVRLDTIVAIDSDDAGSSAYTITLANGTTRKVSYEEAQAIADALFGKDVVSISGPIDSRLLEEAVIQPSIEEVNKRMLALAGQPYNRT